MKNTVIGAVLAALLVACASDVPPVGDLKTNGQAGVAADTSPSATDAAADRAAMANAKAEADAAAARDAANAAAAREAENAARTAAELKAAQTAMTKAQADTTVESGAAEAAAAREAAERDAANAAKLAAQNERDKAEAAAAAAARESAARREAENAAAAGATTDHSDAALNTLLSNRIIYYPTDVDILSDQDRMVVQAHAKHLSGQGNLATRLEGHADERGSSEYNLALGQRRADNVKKILILGGVKASLIEAISYGEEKPVATAHDESAWSQNRRTVIIYPVK